MPEHPFAIGKILPGLADLWAETLGDDRVCIAILDGPVDLSHECFRGSQLETLSTLAVSGDQSTVALAHGTHVASVIFGKHESDLKGIAPSCRGLIVPIFGEFKDGEPLPCSQVDLARAINLAVQSKADVINISGGQLSTTGTAHPILVDAIQKCADAGVLLVAAAGNQGCDCLHIPASIPAVLAVGAMDQEGNPLPFSNWGAMYRERGVLAPGMDIVGACASGGVNLATGTSYATPIISGVIALLMSLYLKRSGRKPSSLQIREALLTSAIGCDEQPTDDCRRLLAGRLNISRSIEILLKLGDADMSESRIAEFEARVEASTANATGIGSVPILETEATPNQ